MPSPQRRDKAEALSISAPASNTLDSSQPQNFEVPEAENVAMPGTCEPLMSTMANCRGQQPRRPNEVGMSLQRHRLAACSGRCVRA